MPTVRYHMIAVLTSLAVVAACSDDASNGAPAAAGVDGATTIAGDPPRTTATLQLDVPTSFISNCAAAQMPTPEALAAIVGIPLADGQVIEAGTCQFLGLNDQRRVVTLALLTDPGDQASFNDLQLSLGASAPLNDATLPNAMVDPSSLVYININGGIYTVRTLITDATPAEQVPLSAAILHVWLGF